MQKLIFGYRVHVPYIEVNWKKRNFKFCWYFNTSTTTGMIYRGHITHVAQVKKYFYIIKNPLLFYSLVHFNIIIHFLIELFNSYEIK